MLFLGGIAYSCVNVVIEGQSVLLARGAASKSIGRRAWCRRWSYCGLRQAACVGGGVLLYRRAKTTGCLQINNKRHKSSIPV